MSSQNFRLRTLLGIAAARFGFRYYDLYCGVFDLQKPVPDDSGTTMVEPVSNAIMEELIASVGEESSLVIERALRLGSECRIARVDREVAGYTWFNRSLVDLPGLSERALPEGVAYHYNSFVFPRFRGKRVFQSLIKSVYRELAQDDFRWAVNYVDRRNNASIRAREKTGARLVHTRIVKIPGLAAMYLGDPLKDDIW